METFSIRTRSRVEFQDITAAVQDCVAKAGLQTGICVVYVPHTTAALTINENADPAVCADMIKILQQLSPGSAEYQHAEGNSDAHLKASLLGASQTLIVEQARLQLGTWQAIYLVECDGPRSRTVWVQCLTGGAEVQR